MKYLKRFNESTQLELESMFSEEIQWIKDVLLDITDLGHDVYVNTFETRGDNLPGLTIRIKSWKSKGGELLPISIGDSLLSIDSYLRESGWIGYNAYNYDNHYSPSRGRTEIKASLDGIENKFERELSQFVKMLDGFLVKAPFDSITVSYFKPKDS